MRRTITDPEDVIEVLAADPAERIIRTHTEAGSEWHLERDRRQVSGATAEMLCRGGSFPCNGRGLLVPVADGLLPGASQTFVWHSADTPVH